MQAPAVLPYSTLRAPSAPVTEPDPPSRVILRVSGILTQLSCAACLLLGTIAFVLVQQNRSGGMEYAIGWGVAAMLGLVFGGLMARGALITVIGSALVAAAFGITLIVIDYDTLRSLLRVLPVSDVDMIAELVTGLGISMTVISALCLTSILQAVRYVRWLRRVNDPKAPASTARMFPPPPVAAAHGSMWQIPVTAPEETRSRRRMYFALGGFAIGVGAGIGVLVSSTTQRGAESDVIAAIDQPKQAGGLVTPKVDNGSAQLDAANRPTSDVPSPEQLVQAQHAAIAAHDLAGISATLWPKVVGFGIDADEISEGRDAVVAQLERDLGDASDATVESRSVAIGQEGNNAWIAEELEIGSRRFAVTQLAAYVDNAWRTVAWHWAVQIPDARAQKLEILGSLKKPASVPNGVDGPKELDTAIRAAFASRAGNTAARSTRAKSFNFGSAPGERVVGGNLIKRTFGKLHSEIALHDGVRAVASSSWDPTQTTPTVAFAVLNADFTSKTKAQTDLTHTFRVLVVLVKEGPDWKIVSSQWSHGSR